MADTLEVVRLKGKISELNKVIEGMTRLSAQRESAFYAEIRDLKAKVQHLSSTITSQNEPDD